MFVGRVYIILDSSVMQMESELSDELRLRSRDGYHRGVALLISQTWALSAQPLGCDCELEKIPQRAFGLGEEFSEATNLKDAWQSR